MRFNLTLLFNSVLLSLFLQSLVTLGLSSFCSADEIYKWTDKSGRTHYSDKPFTNGQTQAKLPNVKKVDFKKRIQKLKKFSDKSCVNHGGIDCSQGVDKSDGSVICLDGHKDNLIKFEERCINVKLYVETELSQENGITEIKANIRNESAIIAKGLNVKFKLEDFRGLEFKLEGAKNIEAYGLEVYTFISREKLDKQYPNKKIVGKTMVKCDNCSNIKRKKIRYK